MLHVVSLLNDSGTAEENAVSVEAQSDDTIVALVEEVVLEYAQNPPASRPIDRTLSLRRDLGIDSLSLVSVALRLGDELNVDVVESGLELGRMDTVGELIAVGRELARRVNGTQADCRDSAR